MVMDINASLIKLFSQNRIVFWHDKQKEMWDDFKLINIKGVEKIDIVNNEFSIKYRILKEKPNL